MHRQKVKVSIYKPLGDYLRNLPEACIHVRMTFEEVEGVLGVALPTSARQWPEAWWSNDPNHTQAKHGWVGAEWRAVVTSRKNDAFVDFLRR